MTPPTVSRVTCSTENLVAGVDVLDVTLAFSEPVTFVQPEPRLALRGGNVNQAVSLRGMDGGALIFRWTPGALTAVYGGLSLELLDHGSVRDMAGNALLSGVLPACSNVTVTFAGLRRWHDTRAPAEAFLDGTGRAPGHPMYDGTVCTWRDRGPDNAPLVPFGTQACPLMGNAQPVTVDLGRAPLRALQAMTAPANMPTGTYAYEFWVRINTSMARDPADLGLGEFLLDRTTPSQPLASVKLTSTAMMGLMWTAQVRSDPSGMLPSGFAQLFVPATLQRWTHVVHQRTGGTLPEFQLVVDGTVVSTPSDPTRSVTLPAPLLGTHVYGDSGMDASITTVRWWNRALAREEILASCAADLDRYFAPGQAHPCRP